MVCHLGRIDALNMEPKPPKDLTAALAGGVRVAGNRLLRAGVRPGDGGLLQVLRLGGVPGAMPGAEVRDGLRALVHCGLRTGGVERHAEPGGGGGMHRRRAPNRVGDILAMALLQPRVVRTRTGEGQAMFFADVAPSKRTSIVPLHKTTFSFQHTGFHRYSFSGTLPEGVRWMPSEVRREAWAG